MADKNDKLDQLVAESRKATQKRQQSYRAQALALYPHVCGRCGRDFTRQNLHELTVHHKDHNHDNNPADGSNWELLCLYCHDNEHQRQLEAQRALQGSRHEGDAHATYNPFADLKTRLSGKLKE